MLKIKEYETPAVDQLELAHEATIMTQSPTGESYGSQDIYGGNWN